MLRRYLYIDLFTFVTLSSADRELSHLMSVSVFYIIYLRNIQQTVLLVKIIFCALKLTDYQRFTIITVNMSFQNELKVSFRISGKSS